MRSGSGSDRAFEPVEVQRGEVSLVLRETGTATPREPVLIKTPVGGVLEWVIQDEKWVEAGDRLIVVNDDAALKEVSQFRTEMLGDRQELALARVRREHAARQEEQKVRAARRAHELATTRHRILSASPKGGRRLIEIHDQLVPLEKESRQLRMDYERAQDIYQEAQDEYLDRLDAWQEQHDAIARTQAQIDQLLVRAEADVDETSAELTEGRDKAARELADARIQLEELRQGMPALAKARDDAEVLRDESIGPRDAYYARISQRDAKEKDLYIQLEIEKRGAELAKLQLDQQIAELTLKEARRKQQEGQAMFDRGSISADQFGRLNADVGTATMELTVLESKIDIASRPAPEEELEEARLRMEQAEMKARTAEQSRDRSLKALDQEIAMLEATLEKIRFQVDRADKQFPSVVESNIKFLHRELEGLGDAQSDRREEILKELEELEPRLERAKANPPNIVKAPLAGIVRLSRRWGGAYYAGLNVDADEVAARIYPAGNLEIRTAINEANVHSVTEQMPVRMTVPALGGRELTGVINLVVGIGKDKWHEFVDDDRPVFAAVTEFETRVRIDDVPEELRPGMTVIVEIELDRKNDVLHLPRGAVREEDDGYVVLAGRKGSPRTKTIDGEFFGDDAFVLKDGLKEGDRVYIERHRSR
jgi:hypothetical protein